MSSPIEVTFTMREFRDCTCPLCAVPMGDAFTTVILGRHQVRFYHCDQCGLLRSERPWWLQEAYGQAIAETDCGLVARNAEISRLLGILLAYRMPSEGRLLDHAGGYGLLVRMLRDQGFDAWWSDPYCRNLLAQGFEGDAGAYHVLTLFEVIEHLHDPLEHLTALVERHRPELIVLSTTTFAGGPPASDGWEYYAFETGQHITFYQERTLHRLANRLGLVCERLGMVRVLSRTGVVPAWMRWIADQRITPMVSWVIPQRKSLMPHDHAMLRRRVIKSG
jgi:hypothetical protein